MAAARELYVKRNQGPYCPTTQWIIEEIQKWQTSNRRRPETQSFLCFVRVMLMRLRHEPKFIFCHFVNSICQRVSAESSNGTKVKATRVHTHFPIRMGMGLANGYKQRVYVYGLCNCFTSSARQKHDKRTNERMNERTNDEKKTKKEKTLIALWLFKSSWFKSMWFIVVEKNEAKKKIYFFSLTSLRPSRNTNKHTFIRFTERPLINLHFDFVCCDYDTVHWCSVLTMACAIRYSVH